MGKIYVQENVIDIDKINSFDEFAEAFGYSGVYMAKILGKTRSGWYWLKNNPSKMKDQYLTLISLETDVSIDDLKAIRERAIKEQSDSND